MNYGEIADRVGALDLRIKALQAERKELADVLKDQCNGDVTGYNFVAKVVHKMDWRLDTKAVKQEMGEAWYEQRSKIVRSRSVRTSIL